MRSAAFAFVALAALHPAPAVPPPSARPHPVTLRRARLDRQRAHALGRGRR